MNLSFGAARALSSEIWQGALTAADARALPGAPLKIAGPHVVLIAEPVWNGAELTAPYRGVSVLALGSTDEAIYLRAGGERPAGADTQAGDAPEIDPLAPAAPTRGERPSDMAFERALDGLDDEQQRIAHALLARIRGEYAGALMRTVNPRRFVETPDNFWGVELQPRRRALKLMIRANEEKLKQSRLAYQPERPPSYYSIKVEQDADVETALKFLALAERKG